MQAKAKEKFCYLKKHPEIKVASATWEERTIARQKRALRYKKMREKGMTLAEIGKKEGLSRERIRQILKEIGAVGKEYNIVRRIIVERVKRKCLRCGSLFETLITSEKKYCNTKCSNLWVALIGKPVKEWTDEDYKKRDKIRSNLPKAIESRRRYFERNKEKIYKKNRERNRERYKATH